MEKKTGYDAVVFDMDGVIFDSERAVMQCWKELADKYQIPDIEKAVTSPSVIRFLSVSHTNVTPLYVIVPFCARC